MFDRYDINEDLNDNRKTELPRSPIIGKVALINAPYCYP